MGKEKADIRGTCCPGDLNPSVHRPMLSPLSHTTRASFLLIPWSRTNWSLDKYMFNCVCVFLILRFLYV